MFCPCKKMGRGKKTARGKIKKERRGERRFQERKTKGRTEENKKSKDRKRPDVKNEDRRGVDESVRCNSSSSCGHGPFFRTGILPLEEGRSRGGSSGENPFLGGILGAFPDIWVSGRAGDIAPGQQTPVDRCGSNCWLFLYFSRYIRS